MYGIDEEAKSVAFKIFPVDWRSHNYSNVVDDVNCGSRFVDVPIKVDGNAGRRRYAEEQIKRHFAQCHDILRLDDALNGEPCHQSVLRGRDYLFERVIKKELAIQAAINAMMVNDLYLDRIFERLKKDIDL